jgi:hypothetical protein
MSKFWHRFTCFLENPETAGVALLVSVIGVITAVAFPWYLVSIGRYFLRLLLYSVLLLSLPFVFSITVAASGVSFQRQSY